MKVHHPARKEIYYHTMNAEIIHRRGREEGGFPNYNPNPPTPLAICNYLLSFRFNFSSMVEPDTNS